MTTNHILTTTSADVPIPGLVILSQRLPTHYSDAEWSAAMRGISRTLMDQRAAGDMDALDELAREAFEPEGIEATVAALVNNQPDIQCDPDRYGFLSGVMLAVGVRTSDTEPDIGPPWSVMFDHWASSFSRCPAPAPARRLHNVIVH